MNTYAGLYIFEGIDNVGKTTIIRALKERIQGITKNDCVDIAFPGNEPRTLGNLVYQIHHQGEQYFDMPINEASLQLLHIAAHIDLIQRRLKPLMDSKCVILLDRFWWSAYVYGLAGGLDDNIIQTIIRPELLFWKEINIKKIFLLERNERLRDYDCDKENVIIDQYRRLAEKELLCVKIDNNGKLEETINKIFNSIIGE